MDLKISYATGEGLSHLASVTVNNSIVLHLLDIYGNGVSNKATILSLNVSGPGKVMVYQFVDSGSGLYSASYVTDTPGIHSVVIRYLNETFPGSPFSVNVTQFGNNNNLRCQSCKSAP